MSSLSVDPRWRMPFRHRPISSGGQGFSGKLARQNFRNPHTVSLRYLGSAVSCPSLLSTLLVCCLRSLSAVYPPCLLSAALVCHSCLLSTQVYSENTRERYSVHIRPLRRQAGCLAVGAQARQFPYPVACCR